MYYKLIDLMRSPELIKLIGEEYHAYMMNSRDQLIKQQIWIVKRDIMVENQKKLEAKMRKKRDKESF
jgi:hypothetical protein